MTGRLMTTMSLRTGTLIRRALNLGGDVRGSEHVSVAVLTSSGALWLMNGQLDLSAPAVAAVSAAAIGSLVPDIDHPQAWISNRIPATLLSLGGMALGWYWFVGWYSQRNPSQMFGPMYEEMANMMAPLLGWAWLAVAVGIALLVASLVIARLVKHRGPTHSVSAGAALALIATIGFAIFGHPTIGLWFGWGYLTHLLTDMITPMGCPALLWPWRPGDLTRLSVPKPALTPMTRPGAKETMSPSRNTSADACPSRASLVGVEDLEHGSTMHATLLEPKPSNGHDLNGQG